GVRMWSESHARSNATRAASQACSASNIAGDAQDDAYSAVGSWREQLPSRARSSSTDKLTRQVAYRPLPPPERSTFVAQRHVPERAVERMMPALSNTTL